jgi:hypothetical protein
MDLQSYSFAKLFRNKSNVLDNNQLISNIADYLTDSPANASVNDRTNGNTSPNNACPPQTLEIAKFKPFSKNKR